MYKRLLGIFLAVACVLVWMPVTRANAAISTDTYNTKIEEFISDARWKNGITWVASQKPKLSSWSSTGCCAYAADFVAYVYGSKTAAWTTSNFTKYTSLNDIRSGDVIYITGHWFVVLSRSGNTLRTAEGSFDGKVRVTTTGWGIKNGKLYNLAANTAGTFEFGYHYKFSDSDTSTVTFSDLPSRLSVSSNDAVIALKMNKASGSCLTAYGARLYNASGVQIGSASSNPSSDYASSTYVDMWYTVSSAMNITLSPGHTYQFEFWATVDGKTCTSAKRTITTSGTATYTLTCYNNFSGKNYLYDTDFSTLNTTAWQARDSSVYTLSADSSVRHNANYSLKITGVRAGASGRDLQIETMTQGSGTYNDYVGDSKTMTLSFWAKSSVAGAKFHWRWGYESTYRSITLSTEWAYYTIQMDKSATFNNYLHPYIDTACTVWLSEVQLEDGSTATSFAAENGGLCGSVKANYGGTYGALPTPARAGYTFDGWYTANAGGSPVTASTSVSAGNCTVYAHWTKEKSDVCDGGEACPSARFVDVNPGLWYHSAVDFAISNGLFAGIDATHFSPNGSTTRAMFVAVLWRVDGRPNGGAVPFVDVKRTDYFAHAVAWAAENGIVSGTDATHFSPNSSVTREQVAAILYRYASYKGYDVYGRADILGFPDAKQVSAYARNAMSWAYAQGLVSGSEASDGTVYLAPKGNATRAQVAAVFMRYIQKLVQAGGNSAADRWPVYALTGANQIRLHIPTAWNGQYLIQENTYNGNYHATIYSKLNYHAGAGGMVVDIMLTNSTSTSALEDYPSYQIIGKWSGGLVVAVYPTDVQCNTDNAQCVYEYNLLSADVPMLLWLMEISG